MDKYDLENYLKRLLDEAETVLSMPNLWWMIMMMMMMVVVVLVVTSVISLLW